MKKIALSSLVVLGIIAYSCSKECSGENPQARIVNNGTSKADVQVQTSGGNTVNINNVQSGTSSAYTSFAPGGMTFTINVGSVQKVTTDTLATCYNYDIVIDASNNISTVPSKR